MSVNLSSVIVRLVWPILWLFTFALSFYISFFADLSDQIRNSSAVVIFPVIFTLVSAIWWWTYIKLCWMDPGSTKVASSVSVSDISLPLCNKCNLPKPERCHHCSQCDSCHFRFDHHCPVLGNCVALRNIKAFILFQLYWAVLILLLGIQISILVFPIFVAPFIPVFCVLIAMASTYIADVLTNRTTLEKIQEIPKSSYNAGWKNNFYQIFGPFWQWMIPTDPPVNGYHWSTNV